MDGPAIECSDSDSGESWTLLENSVHTDDTQDLSELPGESTRIENHEKDEDTDGISIISDSEPDSPSPCQLNYEISNDENRPSDQETAQFISVEPQLNNVENENEVIKDDDDFLGDNRRKNKTYVHRRNKRLSTVLNIVMMASIITAAGVAIGHMWGAKSDCTLNNTPGVNKILSRLYRLQEENAYLRTKLKEITVLNSYQANLNKSPVKQNKCRKMFEESLQNDDGKKLVATCVDGRVDIDDRLLKSHMIQPPYEKDYVQDVRKLRNVYVQNRSWINEKAIKKIIQEKDKSKNIKNTPNIYVESDANQKLEFNNNKMTLGKMMDDTERHLDDPILFMDKTKKIKRNAEEIFDDNIKADGNNEHNDNDFYDKNILERSQDKINYLNEKKEFKNDIKSSADKFNTKVNKKINNKAKINYQKISGINQGIDFTFNKDEDGTDKLNTEDSKTFKTSESEDRNSKDDNESKQNSDGLNPEDRMFFKKDYKNVFARKEDINKNSKENDNIDADSSFEEVKKDNRYTAPKHKQERKKYDRHKSHKREKKRNKYEQWEMKGGLMKDYDDISWSSVSSWSDDNTYSGTKQNLRGDVGENFNCDSGSNVGLSDEVLSNDDDDDDGSTTEPRANNKNRNAKPEQVTNWVDRRAVNRMEARKRLEKELFEDNIATAGWYFKRMRKREQCRAKGDNNSTYRKLSKRFKNHKTKQ